MTYENTHKETKFINAKKNRTKEKNFLNPKQTNTKENQNQIFIYRTLNQNFKKFTYKKKSSKKIMLSKRGKNQYTFLLN